MIVHNLKKKLPLIPQICTMKSQSIYLYQRLMLPNCHQMKLGRNKVGSWFNSASNKISSNKLSTYQITSSYIYRTKGITVKLLILPKIQNRLKRTKKTVTLCICYYCTKGPNIRHIFFVSIIIICFGIVWRYRLFGIVVSTPDCHPRGSPRNVSGDQPASWGKLAS